MANKKEEPEFTVTDRRRFSDEGEPQTTEKTSEAEKSVPRPAPVAEASPEGKPAPAAHDHAHEHEHEHDHAHEHEHAHMPPPTAEERSAGHRAFQQAKDALDEQLRKEVGAQAVADEFKVGFERVIEPFYVTAMMQLGLMGQEGPQRRVDIIGARQTIDTLSYLQEKTKGNISQTEADLLENVLYQLRMQYLEITNAIARSAQNPQGGGPIIPQA